jgi:hypothetical protein
VGTRLVINAPVYVTLISARIAEPVFVIMNPIAQRNTSVGLPQISCTWLGMPEKETTRPTFALAERSICRRQRDKHSYVAGYKTDWFILLISLL